MLSLSDAVTLALENNLDLEIARFNLSIADTDILRTKSGAEVRGVATGLVQGTPGGGVGGFGSGASGGGAGGTSGGAGGAGTGARCRCRVVGLPRVCYISSICARNHTESRSRRIALRSGNHP